MAERNLELALRIKALVEGAPSLEALSDQLEALGREAQAAEAPTAGLAQELRQTGEQAQTTQTKMAGLSGGVQSLAGAFQLLAGLAVVQQFVQANRQAEALRNTLTALTGSSQKSAEEIQWLTETANRLGVGLAEASKGYLGLAAAAKGTALEGEQTRRIFEAVVGAMATLGKSGAEAEGALTAIAQMMGKGVLSAEELRQQLEEALPGATQVLAKALGMTVSDLDQLVSSGSVVSSDVLPALAEGLKATYGVGADGANTLTAQLARLQNALTTAFTQIGDSGGLLAFKELAIGAAVGVTTLHGALQIVGTAFGALAGAIATLDFSQFNATMEEAIQKVSAQVAAVAQYSDIIGPAFKQADAAAAGHAEALDGVTGSGKKMAAQCDQTAGALTRLQFAHQQAAQATDLQKAKLENVANAAQAFGQIQQTTAEQTGTYIDQLQQAVLWADKDAQAKLNQSANAARAARDAQNYYTTLQQQANVLPAVIEAAEKDAIAKRGEADAMLAAATAAGQQAAGVKAANAVILAQFEQQGMSASEAQLKAAQLRDEYERMRGSGASLSELGAKMNEVVQAEDAAKAAAKGYREELALTPAILANYKAKLDAAKQSGQGVTDAQLRYNAALQQYVQQEQAALSRLERRNQIQDQAQSADIAAVKASADLARARGNEAEATRLQIQAGEMAIRQAQDRVAASQAELRALQQSLATAQQKAEADGVVTQAEQAQIQAIQDNIAAKQAEIAGNEAGVVAARASAESSRQLSAAAEEEAAANRAAAAAAEEHQAQIQGLAAKGAFLSAILNGWTSSLDALSPAARRAFDGFSQATDVADMSLEQLNARMEANNQEIAKLSGNMTRVAGGLDALYSGVALWATRTGQKVLEVEQAFLSQKITVEQAAAALRQYAETGEYTANVQQAMQLASSDLEARFALLGEEDLAKLRSALDDANAKLQQMRQETEDARQRLAELNAELLEAQGQDQAAKQLREQLDYEERLAAIEKQRAAAAAANNRELVALLDQQREKLEQIHRLKLQNLVADDKAARSGSAATGGGAGAGTRSGTSAGTSSVAGGKASGNSTFNIYVDGKDLLSEEQIRNKVIPILNRVARLNA